MLSGECLHNIDTKGRMMVPAKFRGDLGEKFVITKGLDNCLFVFDIPTWNELEARINQLPFAASRDIKRLLIGSKEEVEVDKQGRVLIPANLREFASLEKDIVSVGLGTRAEIWSRTKWVEVNNKFTSNPEVVAEQMEELGI
ncbi:MAG: division/cell wall cluster transcriptional repressor MraZ [Clostridiales bacterium]|nr:division/cell wall cluster transcriptional repressor MraZ [Clostridiales bacterium]